MPTGCKNCGARMPTPEEVADVFRREAYVVCRCPNDGTVQEPVACFTDPDTALVFLAVRERGDARSAAHAPLDA